MLVFYRENMNAVARSQLGNFPQAFSHIGLVNTAFKLTQRAGEPNGRASEAVDSR